MNARKWVMDKLGGERWEKKEDMARDRDMIDAFMMTQRPKHTSVIFQGRNLSSYVVELVQEPPPQDEMREGDIWLTLLDGSGFFFEAFSMLTKGALFDANRGASPLKLQVSDHPILVLLQGCTVVEKSVDMNGLRSQKTMLQFRPLDMRAQESRRGPFPQPGDREYRTPPLLPHPHRKGFDVLDDRFKEEILALKKVADAEMKIDVAVEDESVTWELK